MKTNACVNKLIKVVQEPLSYNAPNKTRFHTAGEQVLRQLASYLPSWVGRPEITVTRGSIGSSGEVQLRTDHLLVRFFKSPGQDRKAFLFRRLKSRNDFAGYGGGWIPWAELTDLAAVVEKLTAEEPACVA